MKRIKGFIRAFIRAQKVDLVCFQETKLEEMSDGMVHWEGADALNGVLLGHIWYARLSRINFVLGLGLIWAD